MATIRETDFMVVCVEAAKALVRNYNQEVSDAVRRITLAMCEPGEVIVERVVDNVVNRDIVSRMTSTTIGLVLGLDGE